MKNYLIQPYWDSLLENASLSSSEIFTALNLPSERLMLSKPYITAREFNQIFRYILNDLGYDAFPMVYFESLTKQTMRSVPAIELSLSAPTLKNVFSSWLNYLSQTSPLKYIIRPLKSDIQVSWIRPGHSDISSMQILGEVIFLMRLMEEALGTNKPPVIALLPLSPEFQYHSGLLEKLFNLRVFQGKVPTLLFPAEKMFFRLEGFHKGRWQREQQDLNLARLMGATEESMASRIRTDLVKYLPQGGRLLQGIAQRLHISEDDIRKRLKSEGFVFEDILEALRIDLSEYYLRCPDYDINDVAHMLGFSHVNVYEEHHRGWKGRSPSQYRQYVTE